jgi:hypothetical protein
MLKKVAGVTAAALLMAGVLAAAERDGPVIVTSSNAADNRLLEYDTAGALIQEVPTFGQVGVAGDELIVTEKSGAVERVELREGAVFGTPVALALSEGQSNTPFGLTTRAAIPT